MIPASGGERIAVVPEFQYAARDDKGHRYAGTVEAEDKTAALGMLTERYPLVTRLEKKTESSVWSPFSGVSGEALLGFTQTMAAMLEGGIPLKKALDTIFHDTENRQLRTVILDLSTQLGKGTSLSKAMLEHRTVFSTFYVNMVKAGESSGELPEMLVRVAQYIEKTEALKDSVKSALTYPLVVLGFAGLLIAVILAFGVPYLNDLYDGLGIDLPMPTQVLVVVGTLMGNNLLACALLLLLFLYLGKISLATPRVERKLDSLKLHFPIIGGFYRTLYTARFARTLALLYSSGVQVLEALQLTADSIGNILMSETIAATQEAIEAGGSLSDCLRSNPYFLDAAIGMVAAGEESGQLETMLSKVADFYDQKVNTRLDSLTSTLEPLMMILVGIAIGGIVIALGLPFMTLASAF